MKFTARPNPQLRGFILMLDGRTFGYLVGHTFFSEDTDFETMVNNDLRPKMSRNCILEHIKTRFMAYYMNGRSIDDAATHTIN